MDKMLVVNPIIPDSFLAMRYPLIYQVGNGFSPFINHNFVAANLNNDGLLGDGSSKYFDTGFVPSSHWASTESGGITIYESEPSATLNDTEAGCQDIVPTAFFDLRTFDNGTISTEMWDVNSIASVVSADTPAFYSGNRTSNVLLQLWQENTVIPLTLIASKNTNQAGAAIPNTAAYFMAMNNGSNVGFEFSSKRVSFMAIHEGLKQGGGFTEVQDFFNAVQNFRIALGGGFV